MEARTDDDQQRADRRDGRDQRPEAPREGDQVAARRRRRAWMSSGRDGLDERLVRSLVASQSLVVAGDDVDFDARVSRQPRDLHGRAGRVRLGEVRAVDLVHRREVVHVGQEDRRAHDVGERAGRRPSSSAPMLSSTRRVWAAMSPSTICAGRRDRAAPGRRRTAAARREPPASTGRSPSARSGAAKSALLHGDVGVATRP